MFTSSSPEPFPALPLEDLLVSMTGDVAWWILGVVACVAAGMAFVSLLAKWRR